VVGSQHLADVRPTRQSEMRSLTPGTPQSSSEAGSSRGPLVLEAPDGGARDLPAESLGDHVMVAAHVRRVTSRSTGGEPGVLEAPGATRLVETPRTQASVTSDPADRSTRRRGCENEATSRRSGLGRWRSCSARPRSAIVPPVVEEPSSSVASRLWDEADRVASSRLVDAEGRAALATARRLARIDASGLREAVRALEGLHDQLDVIEVTEGLVREAGGLAEQLGLRGYDAVHRASVRLVADAETVLATGTQRLLVAARARGLATADLTG